MAISWIAMVSDTGANFTYCREGEVQRLQESTCDSNGCLYADFICTVIDFQRLIADGFLHDVLFFISFS